MASKPAKKKLTSAVEGFSVADVRKTLAVIRSLWTEATDEAPFAISETSVADFSVGRFAFLFVLGHHQKRHKLKRKAVH